MMQIVFSSLGSWFSFLFSLCVTTLPQPPTSETLAGEHCSNPFPEGGLQSLIQESPKFGEV